MGQTTCFLLAAMLAAPCPALGRSPDDSNDSHQRGLEALKNGKWDEAIKEFTKAIKANGQRADSYIGRARSYYGKAEYDKSIADCDRALSVSPGNVDAYYQRGRSYQFKGGVDHALDDYNATIRLNPKHAAALANRGYLRHEIKKEYVQAKKDYEESLQYDPKIPNTHNNIGWLLATCPDEKIRDGKRAVAAATKACEMTQWKAGVFLDTLAAAHAEAGNFAEAVKWQKKALEKPEEFPKGELDEAKSRLRLYEEGKPYRVK